MTTVDVRTLRRNPAVEEAPLQGEMMLFDAATSKFFVLNPTMAVTWQACDGSHSVEQIAEELSAKFSGIGADQAIADVSKAVEELRGLGLLIDAG